MKDKSIKISIGIKTAVGIIGISVILSSIVIVLSYVNFKSSLMDNQKRNVLNIAQLIVSEIDSNSLEETHNAQTISMVIEAVNKVKGYNGILDVHIVKENKNKFTCVYTTNDELYNKEFTGSDMENSSYKKMKMISKAEIKDKGGNREGYVIVEASTENIFESVRKFLILLITAVIEITVVLIILYMALVNKFIIKPITNLSKNANDFVTADLALDVTKEQTFIKEKFNSSDEIGDLYKAVIHMEKDIRAYIGEIKKFTAEEERLKAELNIAKLIQESMLPNLNRLFGENKNFNVSAFMQPAKEVGGDFYDSFFIDESRLGVVIADVSGKSVPGALFMVIAKTLIKNCLQKGQETSKVMEEVNAQLIENNQANMFVTAFIGILELETGMFTYTNAGHNYPAILKNKKEAYLLKEKHGFVLAGLENIKYKQDTLLFSEGDRIYLYTDGVTEAQNKFKELFGEAGLLKVLKQCKDDNISIDKSIDIIKGKIKDFIGEEHQTDDITILVLEYLGRKKLI